jgi:hypothetical protein
LYEKEESVFKEKKSANRHSGKYRDKQYRGNNFRKSPRLKITSDALNVIRKKKSRHNL